MKKVYKKPEIKKVELKPAETALACTKSEKQSCKLDSTGKWNKS